jgi:glycopeptide antibiotics resistance protein
MGWLVWKTMLTLGIVGYALVTTTLVLFVWFLFEVGLDWVGYLVLGLVFLLLFFSVKNRRTDFDIRR